MDGNSSNRRLKRGFTTIFLSIILLVFVLALLVIVEAASGYAAKSISENVSATAGRSILSEFNPSLYKRYGIFALDKSEYFIKDKAEFYINSSLSCTKGIVRVKADKIEVKCDNYRFNTDELKRQIAAVSLGTDEYILRVCSNQLEPLEDTAKNSEVEYVLCGKDTDEQNNSAIKLRLIEARTAFNAIEIYSDPQKIAAIREMAYTMFPNLAGEAAVAAVVAIESAVKANEDVTKLLEGGTVPVLDMPWAEGFGDYKDYLLLFLMSEDTDKKLARLMNVMEENCQKDGYSFSFSTAVYGFDLSISFQKKAYAQLLGVSRRTRNECFSFRYN